MRLTTVGRAIIICCFCGIGAGTVQAQLANGSGRTVSVPSPPDQPDLGPGSSDYAHSSVQMSKHGQDSGQYWIFTPSDPVPAEAPVVVFLHGWAAMEPEVYGGWIRHLVRRGNIVIYPRYQEGLGTLPNTFVEHAVSAILEAIERLELAGGVRPKLDHFAYVGHSMGAIMSANIAQSSSRHGLPAPRALMLAEPAFEPILGKYDRIAPDTLLAIVIGQDVKRDGAAHRILAGSIQVPVRNKSYVALPSDLHGNPPLISDHFAPCAAAELGSARRKNIRSEWRGRTRNTLDYYGYWKICDGLLDAAFYGIHAEYALGDTPELRFMGRWSDGKPVEPAVVLPIPDPTESARRVP